MARRSWLLRLAVVCVVLALMLSVGSVEAAKKKKSSKGAKAAEVVTEPTPATPAATNAGGSYSATPTPAATSNPTPAAAATPAAPAAAPTAEELAAREAQAKQLVRKRELARKRAEKRAAAQVAATKAARARNAVLAQRRAKVARVAKSRAAAKTRAEELAAKKRAADTPEIRQKGQEKLKWLAAQTAKSSSRIINMDASSFNQYVNEGPRPYYLMLQFTALTSAHTCHYCHVANDALAPVALAHYSRSQAQASHILSGDVSAADIPDSDLPVFFATVDMARNSELFKELKFQSAPNILMAPPRISTNTLRGFEFVKTLPGRYRFALASTMKPDDFSAFINKNARINVTLDAAKPGFTEIVTALAVLAGLLFVAFKYGLVILQKLRAFQGIKWLVLIVGCGLYAWCISGGWYNIIRGTQWSSSNRDGSTNYINGDSRDQFAVEGIIIGVLNLACAIALVFINTRSFDESSSSSKSAKQLTPVQNLKNALMPFLSPGICLALFVFLWSRIIGIYNMKNPGYRLGLVWRI